MRKYILTTIFILISHLIFGQYQISGDLKTDSTWSRVVYLSLIENHHNIDQIIENTTIDSNGYFAFEGNHLPDEISFYLLLVI